MRRGVTILAVVIIMIVGVAAGVGAASLIASPAGSPSPGVALASLTPTTAATATAAPTATPEPTPSPTPTPIPTPTPVPTPTPKPTPRIVPAPLTGMPVTEAVAKRPVIAVMIDDQFLARPQSGLSQASVVWQAPAEGGIPRYMALFQDTDPKSVGPVRSSRLYFIAWAAEWQAVYVHAGGSPQALALLSSSKGKGKVVYNADEFRYEGRYLYRIKTRSAPHNVYSDAKKIRALVKAVGAKPRDYTAAWQFAPDAPLAERPQGSKLAIPYLANKISLRLRPRHEHLAAVGLRRGQAGRRRDQAADRPQERRRSCSMSFAPLNDGSKKHRLEAKFTGKGTAWIATNGKTVKGTWRKASMTAPTKFYLPDGTQATLTMGQTFVQVVPLGTKITVKNGAVPQPTAAPTPTATPSSTP